MTRTCPSQCGPAPLFLNRAADLFDLLLCEGQAIRDCQRFQALRESRHMQIEIDRITVVQQQGLEQTVAKIEPPVGQWQHAGWGAIKPGRGLPGHGSYGQSALLKSSEPLVPPKPKELERTL